MIDSHAHLLPDFIDNISELVEKARTVGLQAVINSAIEPHHFDYAESLEKKNFNFIYTTLGFSPSQIKTIDFKLAYEKIREYQSLVAIGEVGLDYHWIKDPYWQKKQRVIFTKFIKLANERQKPLVIHSRKAEKDCLDLLETYAEVPVLMHCFSGTVEEVDRTIDLGWLISIPTAVKNRKKHRKIAKKLPIEHTVVETDSPFLSPIPGRKNEPANVRYAIEEIAILKDLTFNDVKEATTQNSKDFFKI